MNVTTARQAELDLQAQVVKAARDLVNHANNGFVDGDDLKWLAQAIQQLDKATTAYLAACRAAGPDPSAVEAFGGGCFHGDPDDRAVAFAAALMRAGHEVDISMIETEKSDNIVVTTKYGNIVAHFPCQKMRLSTSGKALLVQSILRAATKAKR
jgi:hypothetical protein